MSINELATQDSTAAELTDFDGRPNNCECGGAITEIPCWPCYRDGFETVNPEGESA